MRNDVAVRAAPRRQHAHAGVALQTLLQLVQQPALAGTRLADDGEHRSTHRRSEAHVLFQRRQLRQTAHIRRQPGSCRSLQPRRDPGLAEQAERITGP
jgi:hypothetical protein